MKKQTATMLGVLLVAAAAAGPLRAGTIFLNGEVGLNQGTPFSDTVSAITAAFSCGADSSVNSACKVDTTNGNGIVTWSPELLLTVNAPTSMTVQFSQTMESVTLDFALLTGDTLTLTALSGGPSGSQVGSTSPQGGTQQTNFSEGAITFSGASFDTITLSDSAGSFFGIGEVDVSSSSSSVPEPSYFGLVPAIALAMFWGKRRQLRLSAVR